MKTIKALIILAVSLTIAGAGFVYSGVYDIAADSPHWPATAWLVESLREQSIEARTGNIPVPADLDDAQRLRRGAGNYDAMCSGCHLKPGMDDSEIRKGLYPQPPGLAAVDPDHAGDPARQFWIIKHGIKLTAMPAWSRGGVDDATIWDMVALLQKLPALSAQEYEDWVRASAGHAHAGAGHGHVDMESHDMDDAQPAPAPAQHVDPPGAPPHRHGRSDPEPANAGDGHDHQH